jgi:thymidylate kinase
VFLIKICLTGGPCSGKTTAIKDLVDLIESKGYKCFVCDEAATSLINSGIKPYKDGLTMEDFQRFVIKKQLANEELFDNLASVFPSDKIVILYDRGFGDHSGYVDKDVLEKLLKETTLLPEEILTRYDYVLFLVSAAKGAIEHYQWNDPDKKETCNNMARYESPNEAIELDDRLFDAWKSHPQLMVFDNSTDFQTKINNVLFSIEQILK